MPTSAFNKKEGSARGLLGRRPDVCLDIFRSSRDAVILADGQGRVLDWNKAAEKIFGYKKTEVLGKKFHNLIMPGKHKADYFKGMEEFRKTGKGKFIGKVYEVVALRKSGEKFIVELALSAFKMDGEWHSMGIVRDITERIKREKEGLFEKEKYEQIIRNAVDGFWLVSAAGFLLDINDAYCKISGYSRKELMGMHISDLDIEDGPAAIKKQIKEIKKHGHLRFEKRHKRKDGRVIDVEISATHLPADKGRFYTFIRNITEIKEFREKLKNAAKFPEENPDPVIRVKKDGEIIYSNRASARIFSQLKKENKGKAYWLKTIKDSLKDGEIKTKDIEIGDRIYSFKIVPVKRTDYVNVYCRDITEERKTEELFLQTKEDLRRAQAVGNIGSWRLGLESGRLLWSDENYSIFGVPKGTPMTYGKFLEIVHPEDREFVNREWQEALKGKPYNIEHRIVKKDKVRWVRERAELEFDDRGRLTGGFGTTQDITEEKKIEEERLAQKARYEAIIRTSIDGFWIADVERDGFLLDVNDAYCKMSGYSREELLRMKIVDLEARETPEEARRHFKKIIVQGSDRFESQHKRKDGSVFDVEISASYLEGGEFSVIIRDVTERKELDRSRREFVSIASHQLQTPLTIIRWYIERLQDEKLGKLTNEQKEYLAEVRQSATDMTKLVSDLLNVSRVENGRLKIELEPANFKDLIKEIVEHQKKRVKADKCKINIEAPGSLPDVPVDKSLLSQAIGNLIINAINYSKPDDCRVGVKIRKKSQKYIISVQDNGIGIPKTSQNRIFEKFFRAYNAQRKKTRGTGLGLFITKKILEAAGCDIWFESEENRGTTFYVSIPLKGMKQKKGEKQIGT